MGLQHVASLCTLTVMAAVIAAGFVARRTRPAVERRVRWGAVAIAAPTWLFMQTWFAIYAWDPVDAAPLHICDLGGVIAMFALAHRGRWWRAVLFFWGVGLTTQAFVTPVLTAEQGPHTMVFWLFWVSHAWVVGGAVYDFVVLGFRPTLGDLGRAIAVTAGWLAVVFTVNIIPDDGYNYGYVGPADDQPGVVALLGPWPLRVVFMAGIVLVGFTVIYLVASRLPGGDNATEPREPRLQTPSRNQARSARDR